MTFSQKPLDEKDFINEGYKKNPAPLWLFLFIIIAIFAMFWGASSWFTTKMGSIYKESPFLQVTNRDLSVFLWQFPEHMRVNVSSKSGYLTGFKYIEKVTTDLKYTDSYAVAPPELLFLYHTWKRLLSEYTISRKIFLSDFIEFLEYTEEWLPKYWKQAPAPYIAFVDSLYNDPSAHIDENLNDLPLTTLPSQVRQSFIGWKNYFQEGKEINDLKPTVRVVENFLEKYPNYKRNFWKNIVEKTTPKYLQTVTYDSPNPNSVVAKDEITPFLRVALYNSLAD